jgi:hypothetical protein
MKQEERDIQGLWWLPERPDDRWVGTLRLRPEKSPQLQLTIPKSTGHEMPEAPSLVQGRAANGKPITLLFPSRRETSWSAVLSETTYRAGFAIIGIELASADTFTFDTLVLNLQHLHEWVGVSGFQETSPAPDEMMVYYRRPPARKFKVDERLSVEIGTSYSAHYGREYRLGEDTYIEFASSVAMTLERYRELTGAIRGLLHFAILQPVYPLAVHCTKTGYGIQLGTDFHDHDIRICSAIDRDPVETEIIPERWIFRFSDVSGNFGEFLYRWLAFDRKFDEALGCYSATIYHHLPATLEHLCLTQALEAYHGIKFASHRQQDIVTKIRELAGTFRTPLQGLVDDPMAFAETVRDNRHYYTHHNPKWLEDNRVVSGAKLIRLNEKLKLLFQMCILTELGIQSDRFSRLRRQLASRIIEYA